MEIMLLNVTSQFYILKHEISFQVYVLKLLDNVYKQVGFTDNVGDPQLTVFTRIDVLTWACNFGHEDCVQNAVKQFYNWRYTPSPNVNNP